jgi:hypothetical protein
LGIQLSVAVDTSASGKAARAAVAAKVDPGGGQGCNRPGKKPGMKYLIMRGEVFGIIDDHWITFRK